MSLKMAWYQLQFWSPMSAGEKVLPGLNLTKMSHLFLQMFKIKTWKKLSLI